TTRRHCQSLSHLPVIARNRPSPGRLTVCQDWPMAEVVALYRFPVKGFTEEPRSELTVLDDGRIYGDRALTFRYANALEPRMRGGNEVWSKSKGLSRMDYPSLAALRLTLD